VAVPIDITKSFIEDECTPGEWRIFQQAAKARARAAELSGELESMGVSIDVTNAYIDQILIGLCRLGVISKEDYGRLCRDVLKNISSQLQSLRDKRSQQLDAQIKAAKKNRASLAVPQPKKLIVPGR
jgi:hypothetical protein